MSFGKYLFGAIGFGVAGAKLGVAAFGTAFSGVVPAAAVGLLAVKAFSGNKASSSLTDEDQKRMRIALEKYQQQLEPSVKKSPRVRLAKAIVPRKSAPKKVASKKPRLP